ncbi:MAG: dodecin flavoprotein [SAR202 cluster bacterium Io17-Chloro-G9]|nr:MAG: dodecin flavoprotein [SAR202 cluster bacterium Io17-Chloro-G9]
MQDHTYKVVQLVGSSTGSVQQAIDNAISRAGQTLQGLDWFVVKEIRGNIQDGSTAWYQVTVDIGFRVMNPEDLHRE